MKKITAIAALSLLAASHFATANEMNTDVTPEMHTNSFGNYADSYAKATLENMDFSFAILPEKDFSYSVLNNIDFSHADLQGADFTGATLNNVDFSNTNLRDTKFDKAQLNNSPIDKQRADATLLSLNDAS